jgi:ABC-type sugar transport system permease subunit
LRRLFGASANLPALIAALGVGLAIIFAILPAVLIIQTVVATEIDSGPSDLWNAVFDYRNIQALANSLAVGGITAIAVVVLAVCITFSLNRFELTGDPIIYSLAAIPLLIPDYLFGVAGRALIEPQFGILGSIVPNALLVDRTSALALVVLATTMKWVFAFSVAIDVQIVGIPSNVIREAKLDFADRRTFKRVVINPRVRPIVPLLLVFGFLLAFRQQELAKELTSQGGGFRAEMWSSWNFRLLYEFFSISSAAASALFTLLILLALLQIFRMGVISRKENTI